MHFLAFCLNILYTTECADIICINLEKEKKIKTIRFSKILAAEAIEQRYVILPLIDILSVLYD